LPSRIEQVHREYQAGGLTVLAVNLQEDRDRVAAWSRERGLTLRVVLDADGAVATRYRVTGTPTVVLVGRDGRMVARATGARDWTSGQGRALFRLLLAAPGR